jgi:hypothetical protein
MTAHTIQRDRNGWTTVIVLSAGAVVYLLGQLLFKVVAIVGNEDVPVSVPFQGLASSIAFGDVTAPVLINEGVIHVSGLSGLTFVSVLLGELLRGGAPIALLVLLAVFAFRMARERVFDRTNSRLVSWGGIVALVGWGVGGFFAHMGVNGAVATLSRGTDRGTEIASSIDLFPIAVGLALILLGVVFEVGMRMKRDTEGLV